MLGVWKLPNYWVIFVSKESNYSYTLLSWLANFVSTQDFTSPSIFWTFASSVPGLVISCYMFNHNKSKRHRSRVWSYRLHQRWGARCSLCSWSGRSLSTCLDSFNSLSSLSLTTVSKHLCNNICSLPHFYVHWVGCISDEAQVWGVRGLYHLVDIREFLHPSNQTQLRDQIWICQ